MIADGLDRLKGKLWYSNIAYGLLPPQFTISEARIVYEAIVGHTYPAGNFSRDLIKSGLVRKSESNRSLSRGRPAQLFEFASPEFAWINRRS
jgi:8-oxo-dGTP diphosphatase